ncbi:MAG: hypothetical protein IMZ51_01765 [Chloroflexi bacterium]|nr:hypothetical protein [Chloroflexota bacterium]MBE3115100.1 hypothetical protein [Actinomycetota bacterium]
MRKKKIITIVVVGIVFILLVGLFFLVKYDVMGKLYDVIDSQIAEDATSDVTPGRGEVIGGEKIFLIDEEGNEVELVEEVEIEMNVIHDNCYEGTLVNIENNKLFFMVDKEVQEDPYTVEDVEDYQVIFDIDTFSFEVGSRSDSCDSLEFYGSGDEKDWYRFYSAGELEFLVGEYLSVHYSVTEDPYTKAIYKVITFQPSFPLWSSIISFTQ